MTKFILYIVLFWATAEAVMCQSMTVPADIQASVIPKILLMNKNLRSDYNRKVKLVILYSGKQRNSEWVMNELTRSLESDSYQYSDIINEIIPVDLSNESNLEDILKDPDIAAVYITPLRGIDIGRIASLCKEYKKMTIGGIPSYNDYGVTVTFDSRNNKLLININTEAAKEEGVQFSAHLLKIANIVR
jgi:hypothetical protein